MLEGSVRVERVDAWGNRFILERFGPGEVFAEAYACVEGEPLLVDVVAAEACEALFLDTARVLSLGPTADACHARLVRNLLTEMAKKNLLLSRRIRLIAPHTIRERLLAYLSGEALRRGTRSFVIPLDRQQLADYLSVDRSAMCAELGKLRDEGLLRFHRSHFCLTPGPAGLQEKFF